MSSYASPTYVNKDEPCAIVIRLLASLPLQMQKYGRRRSELCYSSVFVRVFCLQQHKPMHCPLCVPLIIYARHSSVQDAN